MDTENIQVNFANVLWVAFLIPSGSLSLVKYPVLYRHLDGVVLHELTQNGSNLEDTSSQQVMKSAAVALGNWEILDNKQGTFWRLQNKMICIIPTL
jgi:hypothetical protein